MVRYSDCVEGVDPVPGFAFGRGGLTSRVGSLFFNLNKGGSIGYHRLKFYLREKRLLVNVVLKFILNGRCGEGCGGLLK